MTAVRQSIGSRGASARNGPPGAAPATVVSAPRRLSVPRRVTVQADDRGRPLCVDGREVDAVREQWLVEDGWWTERPVRRCYWEIVTVCGRDEVVFHDLRSGRWWRQR